ncbi:MAG: hypothetical protein MJ252_29410, partial [archaeon]|nr:hypothetical protein [archaeon]
MDIVKLSLIQGDGRGTKIDYSVERRTPIKLPIPSFIPPNGKKFSKWLSVDSGNYYEIGYLYQPYRDGTTILKAIYEPLPNDIV